jgi:hypothetical protein
MAKTAPEYKHEDLKEALLRSCATSSVLPRYQQDVPLLLEIGRRAGMMFTDDQRCRALGARASIDKSSGESPGIIGPAGIAILALTRKFSGNDQRGGEE